jgi:hypothetical protein
LASANWIAVDLRVLRHNYSCKQTCGLNYLCKHAFGTNCSFSTVGKSLNMQGYFVHFLKDAAILDRSLPPPPGCARFRPVTGQVFLPALPFAPLAVL